MLLSREPTSCFQPLRLPFEGLATYDLDSKPRQTFVFMNRGCQVADRGHAKIPQDLGTDADFSPLPVAIGIGRILPGQWFDRHARGAITKINQHTRLPTLEVLQRATDPPWAIEEIFHDVWLVKSCQDILAVSDVAIDQRKVRNCIERRTVSMTLKRSNRAFDNEG